VLRTMTPADYTTFREALGPSSGFQSYQYRLIEYILGNRNPNMLAPHQHVPAVYGMLSEELDRPSFYDEVIAYLYRELDRSDAGAPAPQLGTPHAPVAELQARWKVVYEDVERYWTLYELAEKLVDLEDYFRRWRFNHVTTVERIIGFKRGTRGTAGVAYLQRMLGSNSFPKSGVCVENCERERIELTQKTALRNPRGCYLPGRKLPWMPSKGRRRPGSRSNRAGVGWPAHSSVELRRMDVTAATGGRSYRASDWCRRWFGRNGRYPLDQGLPGCGIGAEDAARPQGGFVRQRQFPDGSLHGP
jgi:hypothetical protein